MRVRERSPRSAFEADPSCPTPYHVAEDPRTCATSRSSPTSTTARPRSSTPCSGRPAPSGAPGRDVDERVMDSSDLEREKGITILAKNTAVALRRPGAPTAADDDQHHRHPRPRRLRRRGRARPVHGRRHRAARRRLRGPAAADPLRAAQGAQGRPAGRPGGQQGRPPRRPDRRGRRRDLRAVPRPARRAATARTRSTSRSSTPRPRPAAPRLERARERRHARLRRPRAAVPARSSRPSRRPTYTEGAPLQAHVTNLDASPFLGRLALCRVHEGTLKQGPDRRLVQARRHRQERQDHRAARSPRRLERKPGESAGPGDIVAVAGIPEITIGETLADPENPVALPLITRRRAGHLDDHRHQHLAARRPGQGRARSPPAWSRTGSTASWSATCRSGSCRPSAPTPGRCRAAASWRWPSWSSRCAARASS